VTQWIEVTWTEVMEGDHVRMVGQPESEAVVKTISDPWRGHATVLRTWVDDASKERDVIGPHEHVDIFVTLEGRAGQLKFPPSAAVELLADDAFHARRLAVMLAAFPASTPVPPNPARDWNRS
jgi:hypothetical protein